MQNRKLIGSIVAAVAALIVAALAAPALADGTGAPSTPTSTIPSPQASTDDTWWG